MTLFTVIRGTESFEPGTTTTRDLEFPASIYLDNPFNQSNSPETLTWLGIENLGCTLLLPDEDDSLLVTSVSWVPGNSWLNTMILRVTYSLVSDAAKNVHFEFTWMRSLVSNAENSVSVIDYQGI